MPSTIKNPVTEVFDRWSKAIEPVVGKGNYSMRNSQTIADKKKKYAQLTMTGNPTQLCSLEGDECSTIPAFQVDIYASGAKAQSEIYIIDNASHEAMVSMGFRRTKGPELAPNIDDRYIRIISRYSRTYTGQLLEA